LVLRRGVTQAEIENNRQGRCRNKPPHAPDQGSRPGLGSDFFFVVVEVVGWGRWRCFLRDEDGGGGCRVFFFGGAHAEGGQSQGLRGDGGFRREVVFSDRGRGQEVFRAGFRPQGVL